MQAGIPSDVEGMPFYICRVNIVPFIAHASMQANHFAAIGISNSEFTVTI